MGFCVPAPVIAQNLPGLQYFRLLGPLFDHLHAVGTARDRAGNRQLCHLTHKSGSGPNGACERSKLAQSCLAALVGTGEPATPRHPRRGSRSFGAKNNDPLEVLVFIGLFERLSWLW
jgi:hypothetical protein